MDTVDARQQLEQMLTDLDSSSQVLEDEGAGQSSELSHSDQHPGDTAGEATDADAQQALLENSAGQRAQVVAALQRLQDGSYGSCVACGKPIPQARLEVRPEAARCLEDQQRFEASGADEL